MKLNICLLFVLDLCLIRCCGSSEPKSSSDSYGNTPSNTNSGSSPDASTTTPKSDNKNDDDKKDDDKKDDNKKENDKKETDKKEEKVNPSEETQEKSEPKKE